MKRRVNISESDIPLHGWRPYHDFHRERIRAHNKHKDKPNGSMEEMLYDAPDWSDVLTEELGEVSRARNDYRHGLLTKAEMKAQLRSELVQLGAMAAAWIEAIDHE